MKYDQNGWPCIGRFIGLLDDNDNKPIFKSTEDLEREKWTEINGKYFMVYVKTKCKDWNIY